MRATFLAASIDPQTAETCHLPLEKCHAVLTIIKCPVGEQGLAFRNRAEQVLVTRWQEATSGHYRQLEREQRALAADARSPATRDIHLELRTATGKRLRNLKRSSFGRRPEAEQN